MGETKWCICPVCGFESVGKVGWRCWRGEGNKTRMTDDHKQCPGVWVESPNPVPDSERRAIEQDRLRTRELTFKPTKRRRRDPEDIAAGGIRSAFGREWLGVLRAHRRSSTSTRTANADLT